MSRLGIGLEIYFYGYVKVAVILLFCHFGPILIYWSAILVAICEGRTLRLGFRQQSRNIILVHHNYAYFTILLTLVMYEWVINK